MEQLTIEQLKEKYSQIEDKVPFIWTSYKEAALSLAQDLTFHWDITEPELYRVISLLSQHSPVDISQHLDQKYAYMGLYPNIQKTHNILPEADFNVSEWGFHTKFNDFNSAVQYCIKNDLIDGINGILWISSKNRDVLELYLKLVQERSYVILKHIDIPHNWIWNGDEWEDATETEKEGEEDFEQMYENRKEYIKNKRLINSTLDKIAKFGDGLLEFETKDIVKLCLLAKQKNDEAVEIETTKEQLKKSRCCGRCNGIDDICVADDVCGVHQVTGCRICWPDPE